MEQELKKSYYTTTCKSPVGELTLAGDGQKLVGLWISASVWNGRPQKYFLGGLPEKPVRDDSLHLFKTVEAWLDDYFAGGKPNASQLPLAPIGGVFRQCVWTLLRSIPYGTVTTYGAIAKQTASEMGKNTMSAQAVGGAVGHNPISIIIPCHRVVGANGSLTGYAGGIKIKKMLLELEGADMGRLFVPAQETAL
jgi:methylated-DNA-[protein]-cysteine S-methyltransferase